MASRWSRLLFWVSIVAIVPYRLTRLRCSIGDGRDVVGIIDHKGAMLGQESTSPVGELIVLEVYAVGKLG